MVMSSRSAVCMFLTLTDRASAIPSNIGGFQSGTWSGGQEISKKYQITDRASAIPSNIGGFQSGTWSGGQEISKRYQRNIFCFES